MAIPLRYTHEILSLLVRAGLASAVAGKLGGYRLKRAPASITLLEVIEAAEGALHLDRCALSGGPCHWHDTICAVHPALAEASHALTAALRSQTLVQVVNVDERLSQHLARGVDGGAPGAP